MSQTLFNYFVFVATFQLALVAAAAAAVIAWVIWNFIRG